MEQAKAPKLRFRQDDGTEFPIWESITLETEGNFYNGLSGKTKDDFDHGDAKFIPYIAVYNGTFLNDEILKPVDVHSNERQNKIHNGDLLFTQSSETLEEVGMAAVWMSPSTPYLNSFCFGFRLNKQSHISPEFMGHLMRSPYARRLISTQGQGISRFNISASRLGKIHFMRPAAKEQKKIANFFTAFDCRIALADKKLATLQTIKKGMLQKIFSQELRFKNDDGNEFPAWKKCKMKDILTLCHGKDYKHLGDGDYPVIGTSGIFAHVDGYMCDWPCAMIGRKGATLDRPHYMDTPFWCVDTLFYTKPHKNHDPKFQYYLFHTIDWMKYNETSGMPSLRASTIDQIQIAVPCFKEQQKISAYFTAIDRSIAAAQKKAAALRTIKKGLLQKMFI